MRTFNKLLFLFSGCFALSVLTGQLQAAQECSNKNFPATVEVALSADEKKLLVYGEVQEASFIQIFAVSSAENEYRTVYASGLNSGTFGIELDSSLFREKNSRRTGVKLLLEKPFFRRAGDTGRMGSGRGEFLHPSGIHVDRTKGIFVVDTGNDRVQKFDSAMHFLFEFGGFSWNGLSRGVEVAAAVDSGRFNEPVDVVTDLRHIYVSDRGNHRIKKFDEDGNLLIEFGGEGNQGGRFSSPGGLALDRRGSIFVADTGNDRIQKLDAGGNFIMQYGGFGWAEGKLNQPSDIVLLPDDSMLVLDSGNSRLQKFDFYGNPERVIKLRVKTDRTSFLTLFREHYILVSSPVGRVEVYPLKGQPVPVGYIDGLKEPRGMGETTDGELLIVESGAFRIARYCYEPRRLELERVLEFFDR